VGNGEGNSFKMEMCDDERQWVIGQYATWTLCVWVCFGAAKECEFMGIWKECVCDIVHSEECIQFLSRKRVAICSSVFCVMLPILLSIVFSLSSLY